MSKEILELESSIIDWFDAKGIKQSSDTKAQFLKFIEELGELHDEGASMRDISDAIGDTYVILVGVNYLYDSSRSIYKNSHSKDAPQHIHDYTPQTAIFYAGEMSRGLQKDDIEKIAKSTSFFIAYLDEEAQSRGLTLEECILESYEIISKRTGNMVDGIFVKDS